MMFHQARVFLCICLFSTTFGFKSRDEEQKFVADLLNKTMLSSVPYQDMIVFINVALYQLMEINEKQGIATMRIWLMISYYLPGVQWNSSEVNNVDLIYLPPDSVWTPDIVFLDVSETKYEAFQNQIIQSDGFVDARNSMVTLKVACNLGFRYFPFDKHDCQLTASQWIAHTGKYFIQGIDGASGQVQYENAALSGEWELDIPPTYKVKPMKNWYGYDVIQFNFKFKRNPEFYVIVLVIPSILLGILPMLTFLLPVESGEKINLGLTTLLAQVVELLVLSDILPPSSRGDFPIFGLLVIYSVILIVIAIFESVLIACVYNTKPETKMNRIFVYVLNSQLMNFLCLSQAGNSQNLEDKYRNSSEDTTNAENGNNSESDTTNAESEPIEAQTVEPHNWKLLARLIDRLMLLAYFVLLISGLIYFVNALKN